MGALSLGVVLSKLREKRGLRLRELGTLADINHSYIQKLEVGERTAPSNVVLQQLMKILRPNAREKRIFEFVLANPSAVPHLVDYALDNESVTIDELAMAASAAHRGTGRPDPNILIEKARIALKAIEEASRT